MAAQKMSKTAPKTDRVAPMSTGIGILEYPWLTKPDTKFDEDGVFKVTIVVPLDDPNAKALIDKIEEMQVGSMYPYEINEDDNTVTFKAKCKAEYPPRLYDAKKNHLDPESTSIWSGTKARVMVRPNCFAKGKNQGVNLYLQAVQVIDLVAGGGECPFDETEGFDTSGGGKDADFAGDAPTKEGGDF